MIKNNPKANRRKRFVVIPFSTPLVLINGKPIKNEDGEQATAKDICVNALLSSKKPGAEGKEVDGMERMRRHELAQKIYNSNGSLEIPDSDAKLIKELVGELYPPLYVGQIWPLLEPKQAEKKAE